MFVSSRRSRSIELANAVRSRAFDDRLRRPPRLPCARSLCFGSLVSALDSAAPPTATTNARAMVLPRVARVLLVILVAVVDGVVLVVDNVVIVIDVVIVTVVIVIVDDFLSAGGARSGLRATCSVVRMT